MYHPLRRRLRRGMSLAELSLSVAILALVAASMGTMAMTLQSVTSYTRGQSNALQHGRVVLDRLDRTLQAANVSIDFPGFMVVTWPEGSSIFPDTLVIWKPASGKAVDPAGVPQANELVIIRPDPDKPGSLIEITNPKEPAVPTHPSSDLNNWRTLVKSLTSRPDAVKIELTGLLRTALASTMAHATMPGGSNPPPPPPPGTRGCVRFRYKAAPSDSEMANYRAGSAAWTSLAWPQDLGGSTVGMRSLGCFTELQLVPDPESVTAEEALPVFGSTLLWKVVER